MLAPTKEPHCIHPKSHFLHAVQQKPSGTRDMLCSPHSTVAHCATPTNTQTMHALTNEHCTCPGSPSRAAGRPRTHRRTRSLEASKQAESTACFVEQSSKQRRGGHREEPARFAGGALQARAPPGEASEA